MRWTRDARRKLAEMVLRKELELRAKTSSLSIREMLEEKDRLILEY